MFLFFVIIFMTACKRRKVDHTIQSFDVLSFQSPTPLQYLQHSDNYNVDIHLKAEIKGNVGIILMKENL